MTTRRSSLILASCTLALLSGCGSSGGRSSATTASTAGGAASKAPIQAGEAIKVDTTPRFATPAKGAPVQGGLVRIAYRNIAINPDTVRVKAGSTIRWTNYDSTQANVTTVGAGPQRIASKNFGEGASFEVKLTRPGVIHYESTHYPVTMNGTIEVVG